MAHCIKLVCGIAIIHVFSDYYGLISPEFARLFDILLIVYSIWKLAEKTKLPNF